LLLTDAEKDIVSGCKKGNKKAQYQFYEMFKKMIFSVAMRYAKDVPEAEDIVQDAFVVLYRDLYQYRPIGSFGGWVRRVTVNVALQHVRKKRMIFSEVEIDVMAEQVQSDETIIGNINAREIMRMVQLLPDGYRMVFNLYVVEGFNHAEIAEQLNITVNTSKSQLSRAKAYLRKMLETALV
jgi:RNA polymerase sigma factor (sigma-70 family)